MTTDNPLDALAVLLEERRRYEGWLVQLEARRAASPSHVVERVRSDYQGRLRDVNEQLRGRAADLETSVTETAARVAALVAEETQRRDERAETELRALVGEYSGEQATAALGALDEALERVAGERASLGAELARLQDVLATVHPPAPPPSLSASSLPPAAPPPPSAAPTPVAAGFDELAFLQSVVQPRQPAAPIADALSADYLPDPVLTTVRRTGPGGEASSHDPSGLGATLPTPDAVAAFFKDVPTEQVKTLKCAECGTMNYPTEWYCERCGGELAAM